MYFPDANTKMAFNLFHYHDLVMVVMVVVLVLVLGFMILFSFSGFFVGVSMDLEWTKNEWLEFCWGMAPFFFLAFLGYFSLINLYNMEVGDKVDFLVKVTGHQWYWEYRYDVDFDKMKLKGEFIDYIWSWLSCNPVDELNDGDLYSEKLSYSQFDYSKGELPQSDEELFSCFWKVLISKCSSVDLFSLVEDSAYKSAGSLLTGVGLKLNNFCINSDLYSTYLKGVVNLLSNLVEIVGFNVNNSSEVLTDSLISGTSVLKGVASLFMNGDWYYKYDSYIVPEDYLESPMSSSNTGFRNQDVSIPCYLARGMKNEVVISTADVFHSWGVGELGVKADAVPGRHNAVKVIPLHPGMAFGFCYELCGAGHSQMPITVFISNLEDIKWIIKSGILSSEYCSEFFSSMV
uniref:Cytochrome c oxidase subunit 2 n=1 Tax=Callista chinensis TaxID=990943 RepID=A0A889QIQ9_9BIVA|nr:cytochrome c oxidase subunit II [Callista chinensis]QRE83921.1 cytochrome c oxidase subunit II [Callista chinensis]QWM94240.1 cytochrome c oxidase subunit II [Callista chinensis]